MKKILGLLALVLAVSGLTNADQDVLKSIKYSTELRQGWQDKSGSKANQIGNAGFKKDNRARTRWRNTLSGELSLVDEWDLGASFSIMNDRDTNRNSFDSKTNTITKKGTLNKRDNWYTTLELSKAVKIGNLDTTTTLGWYNETYRRTVNATGSESLEGNRISKGIWNDIYFGPTFSLNLFGQNISTKLQAVYFDIKGNATGDYNYEGADFLNGRTEGWGINADFSTDGSLYDGSLGKIGYGIELNHHFRDANGKLSETGKKAKSNVYMYYYTGVNYTTPTFLGGFYGKLSVFNEYEKNTAKTGYDNNFSVWTDLGYKTSFDTAVGTVSVNPYVRYRPLHRETSKGADNRRTREINEVRAGLSIGLAAK